MGQINFKRGFHRITLILCLIVTITGVIMAYKESMANGVMLAGMAMEGGTSLSSESLSNSNSFIYFEYFIKILFVNGIIYSGYLLLVWVFSGFKKEK